MESNKWVRYGSQEYHPTGILAFVIESYPHKEWVDGAKLIESKLSDILVYLELKCNEMHEYWLEQARKRQIQEEEERQRLEIKARKKKELHSFEDFFNQAIRWQQARFMRDYLSTVIKNAESNLNNNSEFSNWIIWAQRKIDWYDPLINAKDDLLDDSDLNRMVELINPQK